MAHSTKAVQDKGTLLRRKADELLEYVREIRAGHVSGKKFSHYTDFINLNKRMEEWKSVLLAECGYVTKQQAENWRFCGAGFDDYRACFYQHKNIQACLSILQRENGDDEVNEALDNIEKELVKAAEDSMMAAIEANKCAAQWIDAWLRKNELPTIRRMMQRYRTSENAEQIDAFLRCWYSGNLWNQSLFDVKNKMECAMYILLSERAHYAATFGGIKGVLGYCKGKGYCFADDDVMEMSPEIQAHFSTDSSMMDFLSIRLSPKNCETIRMLIISALIDAEE